jgi:putative chitinase
MSPLETILGKNGEPLIAAMDKAGIVAPLEQAHFLAQCAHESMGFTRLTENLNYSAEGLHRTWPGRFPTIADAEPFAHHPEMIANHVYSDRMGNGPAASGDGWCFRGRGYPQITGRSNYGSLSRALFGDETLLVQPDKMADPEIAARAGCHFWTSNNIGRYALRDDLVGVTHAVNNGTIGLNSRHAWLIRFKAALGVTP